MVTALGTASSALKARTPSPAAGPTPSSAGAAPTGSSATPATTTCTVGMAPTGCRWAWAGTRSSARGQRLRQRHRPANQRPRRLPAGRRYSRHRRFLYRHPGRRSRLRRPEPRTVVRWRTQLRNRPRRRGGTGRVGHGPFGHRHPRGGRAGGDGRAPEADQVGARGSVQEGTIAGGVILAGSPGPLTPRPLSLRNFAGRARRVRFV